MVSRTTPLADKHRVLLSKEPTLQQVKLYSNFPEYRGFSDNSLNVECLEACLLAAMLFGTPQDQVVFLAPASQEDWVFQQFNGVADVLFLECQKSPNRVWLAQSIAKLFKKVTLAKNPVQLAQEPNRWVSFGFSSEDPLPAWVGSRLLL